MAKVKNKVVQNPTLTSRRFTVLTSKYILEGIKSGKLVTGSSLINKVFKIQEG